MRLKLLEVLACPGCGEALTCATEVTDESGEIVQGTLTCKSNNHQFPIANGIPRFVPRENYAASFGYQWNKFRREQIDSANGTQLSAKRFFAETQWTAEWMKGKWILDAGCGAGRFLDVASKTESEVVGLDISNAVEAAAHNLAGRPNVHFVQASVYELPFRDGVFDGCYCIGVVQHTPDPQRTMRSLPRVLKAGGRIVLTVYERKPWTRLYSKYWLRPLTKRLRKQTLLTIIEKAMPVLFPLTNLLFRLPGAGKLFMFAIPVANYANESELSRAQRYDWAILDTFDMLSPQYDLPRTEAEIETALTEAGVVNTRRTVASSLAMTGEKGNGKDEQR